MQGAEIDWTECHNCDEGYCDTGKGDEDGSQRCPYCKGSGHIEESGDHCVFRLLSLLGDQTQKRLDAAEVALAKVLQAVETEAGQQLPELRLIIRRAVICKFADPWLERAQASRRITLINQVAMQEKHNADRNRGGEAGATVQQPGRVDPSSELQRAAGVTEGHASDTDDESGGRVDRLEHRTKILAKEPEADSRPEPAEAALEAWVEWVELVEEPGVNIINGSDH